MDINQNITQKLQVVLGSLSQTASNQGVSLVKERLKLDINVQSCNVYAFSRKEIKDQINATGNVMTAGVYTPVMGELPGAGFLMLTKDKATKLVLHTVGARQDHPIYLPAFTSQLVLKMLTESLTLSFSVNLTKALQKGTRPSLGAPETFFDTWGNTLDLMFSRLNDSETEVYFIFILGFIFSIDKVDHQGFYFYLVNQQGLYRYVTKS